MAIKKGRIISFGEDVILKYPVQRYFWDGDDTYTVFGSTLSDIALEASRFGFTEKEATNDEMRERLEVNGDLVILEKDLLGNSVASSSIESIQMAGPVIFPKEEIDKLEKETGCILEDPVQKDIKLGKTQKIEINHGRIVVITDGE